MQMKRHVGHQQCPRCAALGNDRSKDNLSVWEDDSARCWSCGYWRRGKFQPVFEKVEAPDAINKAVLPRDFQREVPAGGWKWLLQYGLSYNYWKTYCGYSPSEDRLVITVGEPVRFSQGRALGVGVKWRSYGDTHSYPALLGNGVPREVVLVEDLISAHKVAQVSHAIPLFGTHIHDNVINELIRLNAPVIVWLDADQYTYLPNKLMKLQSMLAVPISYIYSPQDPKEYSIESIREQITAAL